MKWNIKKCVMDPAFPRLFSVYQWLSDKEKSYLWFLNKPKPSIYLLRCWLFLQWNGGFCLFALLLWAELQQKFIFRPNSDTKSCGLRIRSVVNYSIVSSLGLVQVWTRVSNEHPCHSTHDVSFGPDTAWHSDAWGKVSSLFNIVPQC